MKHQVRGRAAAKAVSMASVVALGAALAACGDHDGGGGGGGGGGSLGSADLSSPAGVQTQVGTFGSLVSTLAGIEAANPVVAAGRVRPKAVTNCRDGGTREDVAAVTKDVGSPYTALQMSVDGEKATDCTFTEHQSSGGTTVDFSLVANGNSEGGTVTDTNGDVFYGRVGESTATPYGFVFSSSTDSTAGGNHVVADVDLDFGVYYRLDALQSTATHREAQYVLDVSGDYDGHAESNGQGADFNGTFTSYLGQEGDPFVVTRDGTSYTVEGTYGFGITPAPQGANCTNAEVDVATTTPLELDTGGSGSPYSAGVVSLTSGGKTATVQFNNDGTVTITPDGGTASTVNYAQAVASASPCVGFAYAGIAFAGAAGF